VDSNGILTVKAKEKTTGKEQSIRIEGSTGLSKEDIERMQKDAEMNASDDTKRKDLAEARNIADQAIYAAEKAIKENGEKAGADVVREVTDATEALKTAKNSEDPATIKGATERLSSSLSKIGEAMMKNQTPPAGDSGQQPPPDAPPATDAEFNEKP
jgi:molecular chaperone DnaK